MASIRNGISLKLPILNLIKYIPTGTNPPLVPPKSPKHVLDWKKIPPERKLIRQGKQVGLCDLSTDVKQHISSYLSLLEVELNLRRACRDTFWNVHKPPPDNLEYDFVHFTVFDTHWYLGRNHHWNGVAHTTNDVLVAIWNHDWGSEEIMISLKFVKFDRNHSIVPLFHYWRNRPADFDPLGCHYCGVKQASHVRLDESIISLHPRKDPEQTEGKAHFTVFRHCRDWTPREPRIQLRHIGIRPNETWGVNRGAYCIYYSSEWFEDSENFVFSAPSDSRDKSVILISK